jgi:hypothetical protein
LLPDNVVVTFNGDRLLAREPLHTFEASLETLVADSEGVMRPRARKTQVGVYEVLPDEVASLYEMGLPVVETGDKWHLNIGQKVPLNRDRNNVRPAFLRVVRTAVLNAMCERLSEEDANEEWVRVGTSHPDCTMEATTRVLDLRFTKKRAAYDVNDQEANKAWVAQGGTLVYGSTMSAQEWKNAKEAGAILPAGQHCPTAKPYSNDPNAKPVDVIRDENWTEGMRNIAAYAVFLARELMDVSLTVSAVHTKNNFSACYGSGQLDLNLLRLGHRFFEQGATEEVDRLLIHEFGHQGLGLLGAQSPDEWLQASAWAKRVLDLGLVKAVIPPADQDSEAGRARGLGVVLKAHNGETFHTETETQKLTLRLEWRRGRFQGSDPEVRYRFVLVGQEDLPLDVEQ